jgi:large subunit ribosomal protein L30e
MTDLTNDIRLAVDSGKVAIGMNMVTKSIKRNDAKLIILAKSSETSRLRDIVHVAGVAEIKLLKFDGNPVELGAVCGKPFSVSVLSIIEPGNSNILKY